MKWLHKYFFDFEIGKKSMCIQFMFFFQTFSYVENSDDLESVKKLICSITSTKSISEDIVNNMQDMGNKFSKISQNYKSNYKILDTPCTLIRVTSDDYDLDECYGLTKV